MNYLILFCIFYISLSILGRYLRQKRLDRLVSRIDKFEKKHMKFIKKFDQHNT